jgi:UDP-glucose 4-epimerase
MAETLLTSEECARAIDEGNFYRVPSDNRDLNYDKYFVEGNTERPKFDTFNSDNTEILDVEGVKKKLLELEYIHERLREAGLE